VARAHTDTPPAVILGSTGAALSLTRSLGREGVAVHVLGTDGRPVVATSRHCSAFVDVGGEDGALARSLEWLEGAGPRCGVVLPASDEGVELIVRHRDRLEALGYRLPETAGAASLAMLDKSRTYELAREAGIDCPRTLRVDSESDVEPISKEVGFPCALKPVHSHRFAKRFQVKVLFAHDADELREWIARTRALGLDMLATEIIPGPDDLNWAYRTYLDEDGEPLFGLTTRRIRSQPIHFGTNCYLVTEWNPEVADAGLGFLRAVGLRGLAYTELKRDPRDGRLKLIECNHRFGNAQEVVRRAGLDVAVFTYRRLLGQPTPPMDHWREGVRLWFPARDLKAARDYVRHGELSWWGWLRSLVRPRIYTPVLALDGPRPALAGIWAKVLRRLRPRRHRSGSTGAATT
jgi:predicted ATP-grasp superfamily ATP-dependent carboligase